MELSKSILPIIVLPIDLSKFRHENYSHHIVLGFSKGFDSSKLEYNVMRLFDGRIHSFFYESHLDLIANTQIGELLYEEAITSSVENIRMIVPRIMQGCSLDEALKRLGLLL